MMWNKVVSSLALMRLLSATSAGCDIPTYKDLIVDCHHPDYGSKGSRSTNGKIKAELETKCPGQSLSIVEYEETDGFDLCGGFYKTGTGLDSFHPPFESGLCSQNEWRDNCFQSVKLYIDPNSSGANDAFFIDQLKLTNLSMKSLKWGRNKGRGWCLSNQATDKFTGPNGDINCHPCILFEPDGEWSYCQIEE